MARTGIYKSDVLRARDKLLADGRYPSIDAVREALGNTGSKGTIHRYMKEIEEEEGALPGGHVAVSEAIQDLVGRLAERLHAEAEERVKAAEARHAEQVSQYQQVAADLRAGTESTRLQLENAQHALAQESADHGKTSAALSGKTLECTQLAQQVADLQERIASEERHRQSLEEKHQHARQALEHFRQAMKEQRDQDQRKHEQQLQYLQGELRAVNESLASKQQEAIHALQDNARLLSDLARTQGDLHTSQEEVRTLRPLKDELGFVQRRTEALGQRLVEQEAATRQADGTNEQLRTRIDELQAARQQLELALATAKSSVAAQEQVVASMLLRFSATASGPDVASDTPIKEASQTATRKTKESKKTRD